MKINLLQIIFAIWMITALTGCAQIISNSINANSYRFIGRDVDVVSSELRDRGLTCKRNMDLRGIGYRNCEIKEAALFCARKFETHIEYDLASNKIVATHPELGYACF